MWPRLPPEVCGQVAHPEAEVSPLQTGHPPALQGPARRLLRVRVLASLLLLSRRIRTSFFLLLILLGFKPLCHEHRICLLFHA